MRVRALSLRADLFRSPILLLAWAVGDIFKTLWYFQKEVPLQFILCGMVQILLDAVLALQFLMYQNTTVSPPAVPMKSLPITNAPRS